MSQCFHWYSDQNKSIPNLGIIISITIVKYKLMCISYIHIHSYIHIYMHSEKLYVYKLQYSVGNTLTYVHIEYVTPSCIDDNGVKEGFFWLKNTCIHLLF